MTNSKPWLWLLVASLALNVFLGVSAGTRFLREPKGPPRPEGMILEMAEALPEADARILRQALDARRDELSPGEDPKKRFDEMRAVLRAEPFDPEAFERVSSEFRAKHERGGRIIGEILMDALPRMSPEGRKALADRPPPPRLR
ncbi:MAG: periplasmic heavy metal sensor [Bacteroidota bacterium]